ncbi:MAG: hypothetical protein AB8H79_07930 [Myxococcota bacterium]
MRNSRWAWAGNTGLSLLMCGVFACKTPADPAVVDTQSGDGTPLANVTEVEATGESAAYTFAVAIRSDEAGCDRYADWWEVVSEDGELLYRRVLGHSHTNEQPFTRTGGPVPIAGEDSVWIRAHMAPGGYGGQAFYGSVDDGFTAADLDGSWAADLASAEPLPNGCAF